MTKITRRLFIAASAFAATLPAYARAQESKPLIGVVELFTSQGCSSCPPADAALKTFIERDDVLALAYHVDYWDYLGWKDTLASPENTARQYEYRKTFSARSVYTPQAVVNGQEHLNGGNRAGIEAHLGNHAGSGGGLVVPVSLSEKGNRIHVNVSAANLVPGTEAKLVLVYFKDETRVDIQRGENRGRQISYANTVTDTQVIGMWDGDAIKMDMPFDELTAKGADGCAIILQTVTKVGSPGRIIGAAVLPRQSS